MPTGLKRIMAWKRADSWAGVQRWTSSVVDVVVAPGEAAGVAGELEDAIIQPGVFGDILEFLPFKFCSMVLPQDSKIDHNGANISKAK